MAPNLGATPPPLDGEEVWLSNYHHGYNQRLPRALAEWTRYFNLHGITHQKTTYPDGYKWYQKLDGTRPVYFQKVDSSVPGCVEFPRAEIQAFFPHPINKYFTCSGAWLIALAIVEGFERIELWGFEIRPTKPAYAWERPNMFFWIEEARKHGVDVWIPPELKPLQEGEKVGDPHSYSGPLYGYETKPETEL